MTADHPVRPWVVTDPCTCTKPKTLAPEPSPAEQAVIDRFGIFDEEQREHLVYADENGVPEECIEECPGCHWEGNLHCEALPYGCDLCDPDGVVLAGSVR